MTTGAGTTAYAYDDADRLTTVTPPSPASAIAYTWDDNGNLTDRGADEFSWDYEDRMVSATVNAVTTSFVYRGDGLRDSRAVSTGATTTFTWDIASGLPVVLDDGNQYVYGAGLASMKQGGTWYYYLADGLGSTMAVVDSSGNSQKSYQYDVYGEVTGGSGSLANEFGFAGQQTDATGLQYLRARYYDPETGTFIARDPLALLPSWQELNFAYVGGAPTTWSDPTGLYWGEGAVKGLKKVTTDVGKSLIGPDLLTTVLQVADVLPIAEICFGVAAGGLAATGAGLVASTVGGVLAYKACGPIEQWIGSAAFAASTTAIARANCSPQEKIEAQGVNYINFIADAPQIPVVGEFIELEAYLTQAKICPSNREYPGDQSRQ